MYNADENEVLRDALSGLNEDVPPMPEELHAAWMNKIGEEPISDSDCLQSANAPSAWALRMARAKQKVEDDMQNNHTRKTFPMQKVTRWLSIAAAMVFIIGGTLLTRDDLAPTTGSASNQKSAVYSTRATADYDYAVEESADYEYGTDNGVMLTSARGANTAAAPAVAEKKIIRTASMTIATQAYDDSLNALKSGCTGQGGWIESSSENVNSYSGLRTAYLTLRVPQSALDAYLAGTADLGRITARSESAQDVTESYQDTAARLETQKALMARLQALITESADLSDLLALESQIADTQYEIDRLQASLNSTDRQVTYSTVNITLKEEKTTPLTETTVSFWDRIVSAVEVGFESFVTFLQDMVVFLVAALPFIVIVAAVVIVVRIIRKRRK